jgi:hypothetical protein
VAAFDFIDFPSKTQLLDGFAYLSLFLTLATVMWPKCAALVKMIWTDYIAADEAVQEFKSARKT